MSQLESDLQPIEELYDPNSEQYSTNPTLQLVRRPWYFA
jgi:hypothetical protein